MRKGLSMKRLALLRLGISAPALLAVSAVAPSLAHAQAAPIPAAEDAEGDSPPEITVTGRRVSAASETIGEDKVTTVVAVTREALLSAPSGVSGLKMLEQLPGFNVQTDGALGLYEFGNSVQTRAFNLDQIGFLIDGIPTGRSDAFGGSPVFRYVDNENLAGVEASVGAGDVSLPSYSSLGPVISYNSIAPQDEFGVFASQTFGDDSLKRTFIRVSTGKIGPFAGYVSRTKLNSNLWRGTGTIDREHWEAQVKADLGGDSWLRLKFVSNDFFDYDSPTLTRAQYYSTTPDLGGNTGRYRGYIDTPSPTTAGFTPTTTGVPYSNVNYTYTSPLAINVRNDKLYGGTVHLAMAPGVYFESTLYWENKQGYGVSPDSYDNSLSRYTPEAAVGLAVVAPKGTQYGRSGVGGDRYGITNKLHWDMGAHTIEAGIWYELDEYNRTQLRVNTVDGSPASAPVLGQVVYYRRNYQSERNIVQLFAKDTIKLMDDRLQVQLGVKGLDMDYQQRGYRDFADYYRIVNGVAVAGYGPQYNRAHYKDFFLPQVGALYKLDSRTQMFASYSENVALPKGMDDIYSVTLASGPGVVPAPAPERSQNFEVGIRTNQPQFYASLSGFYTKFQNRIQSITTFLAGSSGATETFYTNVGRVKAYGAELTATYKPAFLHGLAYFNLNATYNHATFQDNIVGSATVLTAGKYLPDSAKWVVNGGVTVEPASWLVANFSGKHTGTRWSTMANTPGSAVAPFTVFSAYVDIGDGWTVGPLKTVKARFNLDNVFDTNTLAFISPAVSGDGSFRPQSPRTFQFTLSAEY
ncbi:TonB-dependent receptor [Novosphingobium flavum]|uniref:TonB-dependent receptor n=1 Tax=Novosphingobium flavum TaxID=1778672 RepID=A0A7X1KM40_9SPHN|nr:TonB-dependent receptor [Novosphingobium flavum]MBC2665895.1 TonB-dependent receptor [Novosphingobium flavum]